VSDTAHHVGISPSGLLVEIFTVERGQRTGFVQIDRRVWPDLVQEVATLLTERRVAAEVENILDDGED
jgi:hypothetical protein